MPDASAGITIRHLEAGLEELSRATSRERILAGACELLDASTYTDFTVDALARALRMSKSTLYRYFISKEAIIETLVDTVCDVTDAAVTRIGLDPRVAARTELDRLVAALANHVEALPRAVLLELKRLPSSAQARLVVTRLAFDSAALRVLRLAQTQGHPTRIAPEIAAPAFMAALIAAMEATARLERPEGRPHVVRTIAATFGPGLIPAR